MRSARLLFTSVVILSLSKVSSYGFEFSVNRNVTEPLPEKSQEMSRFYFGNRRILLITTVLSIKVLLVDTILHLLGFDQAVGTMILGEHKGEGKATNVFFSGVEQFNLTLKPGMVYLSLFSYIGLLIGILWENSIFFSLFLLCQGLMVFIATLGVVILLTDEGFPHPWRETLRTAITIHNLAHAYTYFIHTL